MVGEMITRPEHEREYPRNPILRKQRVDAMT